MKAFLTIKIMGVLSAVVGPMPDWNACTAYLPDFEKRADAVFTKPDYLAKLQAQYPGIKRENIVHECVESDTKPVFNK